jgi:hypothetical protein
LALGIYLQGSCDEMISHLKKINNNHFAENPFTELFDDHEIPGKKINKLTRFVEEIRN